jgi:predicted RNA polymerase sigma factor
MGGKQPFDLVVATHGATVLRVCRAVLGPVDADDAWSETFLSAMKAYPDLPADASVEAWLVTIAHRKATTPGSRPSAPPGAAATSGGVRGPGCVRVLTGDVSH